MDGFKCCSSCRYAVDLEALDYADGRGGITHECRRFPPQVLREGDGECNSFPCVCAEWWCGEYAEREDSADARLAAMWAEVAA